MSLACCAAINSRCIPLTDAPLTVCADGRLPAADAYGRQQQQFRFWPLTTCSTAYYEDTYTVVCGHIYSGMLSGPLQSRQPARQHAAPDCSCPPLLSEMYPAAQSSASAGCSAAAAPPPPDPPLPHSPPPPRCLRQRQHTRRVRRVVKAFGEPADG